MLDTHQSTQDPSKLGTIHVVIVEDLREVREGLTMLINGTHGFCCVGSHQTMEDALLAIGNEAPDVILTDLGLPGMSGVEGTRILRERFPNTPILALTVYDNDDQVFGALCAGANGYLLKNTPPAHSGAAAFSRITHHASHFIPLLAPPLADGSPDS